MHAGQDGARVSDPSARCPGFLLRSHTHQAAQLTHGHLGLSRNGEPVSLNLDRH